MEETQQLRVLNPTLYSLLRGRFGRVDIANEGIAMCGTPRLHSATAYGIGNTGGYAPDLLGNPFSAPRRRHSPVLTWGEYYRVNCFAGETQVATPFGDKPISSLVGRSQLLIPNARGLGSWQSTEVRAFGLQPLLTVRLRRRRTTKTIRVTPAHRWVLRDKRGLRRVATTSQLTPGDVLASCYARTLASYGDQMPYVSAIGVAQGFVFGDGSCEDDGRSPASVRFCADKDKSLLPFFSNCRFTDVRLDDRVVPQACDLPRSWKALPSPTESLTFLLGWFAGYFAADGYVSPRSGQAVLYSATLANLEFVKGLCYRLGVRASPIRPKERSSDGCVPDATELPMYELSFPVRDVPDAFWIQKHHKRYAVTWLKTAGPRQMSHWVVDAVLDRGEVDEVFCAIVPGIEQFTLADNVLTMNCPFCRESQRRLWINHLYGTRDENGIPQQWLAHCYNEKCTTDPTARSLLEQQIFGLGYRQLTPILPGENISAELQAVQPPGHVTPLHELPPDHKARTYLLGRRFDPDYLSRTHGVGYVTQADPRFIGMQGRIYIPIWMNNQLVSWQGRWPEDLNWKAVSIPKYYNRPGPKGRMFYNNDTAMNWPFVVVVEGIPSVWRIGGPAVSMLGKSMTGPQRLLLQRWAGKPIIIMLDHDAFLESEGLLRELRTMVQSPVIEVRLPDNYDPGDYSHEADVAMICAAAAQQGIALSAW